MKSQKSDSSWLGGLLFWSVLLYSFFSCSFVKTLAKKMKMVQLLIIDASVIEIPDLPRVEGDCTQVVFYSYPANV